MSKYCWSVQPKHNEMHALAVYIDLVHVDGLSVLLITRWNGDIIASDDMKDHKKW